MLIDVGGARLWIEPRWAPRGDEAGAVLILRDVTEARKHALFVRALETVGRSLTSSLDIDQVLDTIVDKTREVMGADAVMVAAWDGRASRLTILRAAGRLTGEYAPGGIPLAGGPVSVAAREGRPVSTSDVLADPRWQPRITCGLRRATPFPRFLKHDRRNTRTSCPRVFRRAFTGTE